MIQHHLHRVYAWIDCKHPRERAVLLVSLFVGTLLLFEGLWWGVEREQGKRARAELQSLTEQRAEMEAQLEVLESENPDGAVRQQIDLLGARIGALDEQLESQTLQILPPQRMPEVLRDLIASMRELEITAIRSELPQQLMSSSEDNLPVLYRHGVVIEMNGRYLALLDFVRELEALPWRLYWLGLEIEANDGQPGTFRLYVYTLSLDEEWIRV